LRLKVSYIWIGKSICLETETKDMGICKVLEQLQETMVIICLAALVPQEQLVEMIPGFQFSFQKFIFLCLHVTGLLTPKVLVQLFHSGKWNTFFHSINKLPSS
jgi:hypothetical protein